MLQARKDFSQNKSLGTPDNIKETCKVLNKVISRKQKASCQCDSFMDKHGKTITDKKDISDGFDIFFVNLANKIEYTGSDSNIYDCISDNNSKSLYLNPVVEQEVLDIVNKSKSKSSLDCDNFSMSTLKKSSICVEAFYLYMQFIVCKRCLSRYAKGC